jgi:4-diphosphocytidyl-2C-methyl-D-erythritol kinase
MKVNHKIDILKFYAEVNHQEWNAFLTKCYRKSDVAELLKFRNAFQQGMADLEKQKMNSEKIAIWFVRIQRSIENTLKQIFRDKNPNPLYDPMNKDLHQKDQAERFLQEKRKQQNELEQIIKLHNY